MNKKQTLARGHKIAQQTLELRKQLWPNVTNDHLWLRKERKGFTTVPRTMPLIARIVDELSPKGRPASQAYLSLWCRVHDECVVTVNNELEMAYEAGFGGERAVSTWKARMRTLQDNGFIDGKAGSKGEWNYVLLFNPYQTIKGHFQKGNVQLQSYTALLARAQEIGASDLI